MNETKPTENSRRYDSVSEFALNSSRFVVGAIDNDPRLPDIKNPCSNGRGEEYHWPVPKETNSNQEEPKRVMR